MGKIDKATFAKRFRELLGITIISKEKLIKELKSRKVLDERFNKGLDIAINKEL